MDPFEFVAHIPFPHCRVGIGERCVTKDGYVRKISSLHRVKLAKSHETTALPDSQPDSQPDSEQYDGDYGRSGNE
jgi:hypothetical protein